MTMTRSSAVVLLLLGSLSAQLSLGFQVPHASSLTMRQSFPKASAAKPVVSRQTASPPALSASADASATDAPPPHTTLSKAYMTSKRLYLVTGMVLAWVNERSNGLLLDRKFGALGGLVCAAGVSHILAGATRHGRLNSDTYKRLNIGLMGYNILGVLAFPGEGGLFRNMKTGFAFIVASMFVKGFGTFVALTGWKEGIGSGVVDVKKELMDGTRATVKATRKTHARGTGYRNVLLLFLAGMTHTVGWIAKHTFDRSPLLETSLYVSGLGRLFLLSCMLFSLKDAGERDRLKGTTFIQMNYLIGLWFLLTGVGQAIQPGADFFAPASALLPFSIVFLFGGYIYHLEKIGKLEYAKGSKGRWIVVDEKGWNKHFFDR